MQDLYYLDYRRGMLVKNLDTAFLAPEEYTEVVVMDSLVGVFEYHFKDTQNQYLAFKFTAEEIPDYMTLEDVLERYLQKHNFDPNARLVRKIMYVSQKKFDEMIEVQGGI